MDDTFTHPAASTRRRFLAHAAGGTALLASGAAFAGVANAQEAEETDVDVNKETAVLAETFELAAVEVYRRVGESGRVTSPLAVTALSEFSGHHAEHARGFASLAGRDGTGRPNQRLVQVFADQLEQATSEQDVLRLAFDLETAVASTYVSAAATIDDDQLVAFTASVLPVESQHAAVAGRLAGVPLEEAVPAFEDLDLALDITQYPATTTTSTTTA